MIEVHLPWPPSVNHYYRRVPTKGRGVRVLISKAGREYKEKVEDIIRQKGFDTILKPAIIKVDMTAHPPDRKDRDLDNLLKAMFDSMEGGLFENDSQIKALRIIMGPPCETPFVNVRISEITHG